METTLPIQTETVAPQKTVSVKIFGVGGAGRKLLAALSARSLPGVAQVAVGTDPAALAASPAAETISLETPLLRGLGTGGDPERGRQAAAEHFEKLKAACAGVDAVFILTGLGGGTGTGISPVLARAAKESGALVLAFVTMPFACEGARRQRVAQHGGDDLKTVADAVICLPNQKIFKLIDENTSVVETFRTTNELLAEGVQGLWRLLTQPGLLEIHLADVCALLRGRHGDSSFATAEAAGENRAREVLDKLFAHPMFDGGKLLAEAEAVLVSLTGGSHLTMAEVNRVMEHLNSKCAKAQVIFGAAIDADFGDRLAVLVVAARRSEPKRETAAEGDRLPREFLSPEETAKPGSRFLPPPPELTPEKLDQLTARPRGGRSRKAVDKWRQGQLPLELISKGRFDKSEPTIHKGEDLDVPTYIRRGVALN